MTKDDFGAIVMAIRVAYPKFNTIPDRMVADFWYELLCDIDYETVHNAVLNLIKTNKFPPSIAEIREQCARSMMEVIDCGTAWERVRGAIHKYGYYREQEAMQSLDPLTASVVKRIGFTELCMSENMVAERAHFFRLFEEAQKRWIADNIVSAGVKCAQISESTEQQPEIPEKEEVEDEIAGEDHISELMREFRRKMGRSDKD